MIKNVDEGGTFTVALAAETINCRVYVRTDDPMASNFLPTGTTPHANATKIANEFQSGVYRLITSRFGELQYIAGTAEKINLILYDIEGDGNTTGGYTAGFFHGVDYTTEGNMDTNLYIDIGQKQGYSFLTGNDPEKFASFMDTVAHELQHLINRSEFLRTWDASPSLIVYDAGDPDLGGATNTVPNPTTWYNEGLSELAGAIYMKSKSYTTQSRLEYFLTNTDGAERGYIPTGKGTTNGWAGGPGHYGSVGAYMREFYASVSNVSNLVKSPRVGYNYSLRNVGDEYNGVTDPSFGSFNEFFKIASLNIQVDSPEKEGLSIRYYTDSIVNTWSYKSTFGGGVEAFPINTATTVTSGGTYHNNVYLADAIGAGESRIKISIPASPSADYFIITPYDATGITERSAWDDVPKMAAKLNGGDNIVTVGTNNRFAVLVINYDTSISESMIYNLDTTATPVMASNPLMPLPV